MTTPNAQDLALSALEAIWRALMSDAWFFAALLAWLALIAACSLYCFAAKPIRAALAGACAAACFAVLCWGPP